MSKSKNRTTVPRSIRHKRILDIAADQPDASLEAIASEVPSATADLVENVLDEYGDPADDEAVTSPEPGDSSMVLNETAPNVDELSSKQREILRLISENPEASQRELGEKLDVSGSTVSNRANSIDGFEWKNRQAFVEGMFDNDSPLSNDGGSQMSTNKNEYQTSETNLTERVKTIEQKVDGLTNHGDTYLVFDDIDLVHKVVHACMESNTITKEEELTVLKLLLE